MEVDASGWSGEGEFTKRLIDALEALGVVNRVKVEDAPASRADAGFSFISNELFVFFASTERIVCSHRLRFIPRSTVVREKVMSLAGLETALAGVDAVGGPDYSDEGMLQVSADRAGDSRVPDARLQAD